jgi:D-alanine-D-alanine ligase
VAESVRDVASRTYETLGCAGFARVDLMLGEDSRPEVLEANAIPGLTDTSLLPMAAHAAGLEFEDLVARIIELALEGDGRLARPRGA